MKAHCAGKLWPEVSVLPKMETGASDSIYTIAASGGYSGLYRKSTLFGQPCRSSLVQAGALAWPAVCWHLKGSASETAVIACSARGPRPLLGVVGARTNGSAKCRAR